MLDKSFIGHEFPSFTVDVEKGRLRFFAKAIGETNPIYIDESAAVKAGYRALPAPPTIPFSLDMDGPELLPVLRVLQLDIARVLHGSQEFEYHAPICAGDRITVTSRISDIFDKKGGALEFVVMESSYSNQDGDLVAQARNTLVYRN
jgi:hydroxyacyl-ACP dehydratase HTD2-like protein with hotdog domain